MLTRFAPSPTGFLHIGNIRTALICYLYAKKQGGKFMLRIDDTDTDRSEERYVDAIKNDLAWLGINPDFEARQSQRHNKYDEAIVKLKESGRLYKCYETAEELDFKRKMQLGQGKPPVYDRTSLKLTEKDIFEFETEGRTPHWRFKLDDEKIVWDDGVRGVIELNPATMSDPILVRENGAYTYMLPSTVDDIDFDVTHVIRGEDHISNTAIQIQIFDALGGKIPKFAHNALIKTKDGNLSKRDGGGAVSELKSLGIQAMAINSFLAKVGSSDPVELRDSLEDLISEFSIAKFGKSPTMYSFEDISRLNTKALHESKFEDVKGKLPEHITEDFWQNVKANIENLDDVSVWWKICHEDVQANFDNEGDDSFVNDAANLLPDGEITKETWNEWLAVIKSGTDRKGKQLFMPLRQALTGMSHGPELKNLLPLIGRDEVLRRLKK